MSEFFEVITSVIDKKRISEEDILKHYNGFMVMNWLSGHPKAAWLVNSINSARGNKYIAKEKLAEYKSIKYLIDLPKNTKISFDKKDKNQKIIINVLMKHYLVGKTTAEDYYKILGGNRVLVILELYARKNEKNFGAAEMKFLNEIRGAITSKKKELDNLKGVN